MQKHSKEETDWDARKAAIIGLGEHSLHKNYYPQLRANLARLERFRLLLDQTSDIVILTDLQSSHIVDANTALGQFLGARTEELIGRSLTAAGLEELADAEQHASGETGPDRVITLFRTTSRGKICVEFQYSCCDLENGRYGVFLGRDVTEKRQQHELITSLLSEKDTLLENAPVGIVMLRDRVIQSCNRRFEAMFGYPCGSLAGKSIRQIYVSETQFSAFGEEAYRTLMHNECFTGSQIFQRADGSTLWCEVSGNTLDPSNPRHDSIWILTDITERRKAEDRARFLAYHDTLTGLPNREIMQDRMVQAIRMARRGTGKVALLMLDIDRFKSFNDALGLNIADQLLVEVSRRLQKLLSHDDGTLCRQSGDEFFILLPDIKDAQACIPVLEKLHDAMSTPFRTCGQELNITASIGISLFPEDGENLDELLRHAEMAMYHAKDAGRNTYRFFDKARNETSVGQLNLYSNLRRALDTEQFELFFQPQIDIRTGCLIGAEALIRWNNPELGYISPAEFIPAAEFSGLIVPIGEWVLHEACTEAALWKNLSPQELVIAVNLSALQFKRGNLEQSVQNALRRSGLEPRRLELELTESILIQDTEEILATVVRLKDMGLMLSIDDFGTGYSSLSYLKRFKVDKLKIDQSFVRSLTPNGEDSAIVRAVIQMAQSLGLQTIAEGVETRQSLDLLRHYQCNQAQGYFVARPMPATDFREFILRTASPAPAQNRCSPLRPGAEHSSIS